MVDLASLVLDGLPVRSTARALGVSEWSWRAYRDGHRAMPARCVPMLAGILPAGIDVIDVIDAMERRR